MGKAPRKPDPRKQLERSYDRLYALYESGDISPEDMDKLYDLDAQLRPGWEAQAARDEAQSQPMMYDPEVGVPDLGILPVADPLYQKARRLAEDYLPYQISNNLFGRPASQDFLDREGLLGITGVNLATRLIDAPRNSALGNPSQAGADLAMGTLGLLGLLPGGVVARSARGAAPGGVGETAATVYRIGDQLVAPSGYRSISGKPSMVSIPDIGPVEARPVNPIEQAAKEYMDYRGMDASPLTSYPRQDPERGRLIAAAYDMMKDDPSNPAVRRAYDAMVQETLDQYNWLKNSGIEFKFLRDGMPDPYEKSPSMGYRDLVENGRLWVFPTEAGYGDQTGTGFFDASKNPLLRRVGRIGDKPDAVANDAFRAVHDAYGHFGPGNPFFRAPGEERAWIEHSRMYSPEARGAMTSETRGQNSWVNFGPFEEYNRTASGKDTRFADQKVGLLDPWAWEIEGMPSEQQLDILLQNIKGWRR